MALPLEHRRALFDRFDRATRVPMLALALVFLVVILLLELGDLSEEANAGLEAVVWITWGVFVAELVIKTYLAPDRRQYLLDNWLDVLTVAVPFLRALTPLRLVVASARLWGELRTVVRQQTFSLITAAGLVSVWVSAVLVFAAERGGEGPIQEFPDALWWAVVTVTTVGYGDMFPKTNTGRGIAVALMLIGISLFGLLTARVAAFLVEADKQDNETTKLDEVLARLDRIERRLNLDAEPDASRAAETPQSDSPDPRQL